MFYADGEVELGAALFWYLFEISAPPTGETKSDGHKPLP